MTDLMKLFAEMDSMGVEELMRQSWQRAFGIMRILRGEGKFCDVTLHCEMVAGAERNSRSPPLGLVAHKVVLVSWSGYFRNLMDVGLFEEVEVIVPGVSYRALAWLLDLMYGETEPAVNEDNVDTIFQAAMILQVPLAVSLCAQMMKQRRRGALIGDIVSSTIPEADAGADSSASMRGKVNSGNHTVSAPSSSSTGLPVLQRAVKMEAPSHAPHSQDCLTSSVSFMPRMTPQSERNEDGRNSNHPSDDGRFGHESDGEDCLDSNSNQRRNSESPYRSFEVPPPSLVATSPRRQIISATRTPIFKPKMRSGPRPIAAKTSSAMEHFRQSPATTTTNGPTNSEEGEPQPQTLFVPMPTLTPTSVASMNSPATYPTGMVGTPGLSMAGMAALGALQLAPILVSSSSAPSPSPQTSTSPEGDAEGEEGRLVINEDELDDLKNNKRLKIRKRQKVTGMELVPVGDESMDGALVPHSPKGSNLTIVAICNICQKGFTSKTGYKKHIRTHMGAFPYHCPVCNKGYFDHYTLQEHLNAHKGLKVHGCTGCGKKYQRKKNLVIHQRNCTGVPETIQVTSPHLTPDLASLSADAKDDGSNPEGSEVRMLTDGPWSENGSESLHEDEEGGHMGDEGNEGGEGGGGGGAAPVMMGRTGPTSSSSLSSMKEEDCGMMVAESEGGKGMILVSPTKREPTNMAMTTTGYPPLLPKGTLIKQLLKQESASPSLTKQHQQHQQIQQQQQQQQQQKQSTKAFEETKSPSAFAAFGARSPLPSMESGASRSPAPQQSHNNSNGDVVFSTTDSRQNGVYTPSFSSSSSSRGVVSSAAPNRSSTTTSGFSTSASSSSLLTAIPADGFASAEESLIGAAASTTSTAGKEKFQCPHCVEVMTGRKNLQDHMAKVHAQPDKFTCPNCGRIFKYMTSLAHHIQTVCNGSPNADAAEAAAATEAAFEPHAVNPGSPSSSMTKSPSASQTSPLTPSRKSRRISKRNSGGGPGLEDGEVAAEEAANGGDCESEEKKNVGKVLQMQGVEGGELTGGYVILNEEDA